MMRECRASIILILSGCLASFLTGCATHSQATSAEPIRPPTALLTPCTKPQAYQLKTNQDLARFASSALLAWQSCAAQIDALRLFYGLGYAEHCPKDGDAVIVSNGACKAVCHDGQAGPCFEDGKSVTPCFEDDGATALCDAEWIEI